jgi:hypothetical protein
MSKIKTREDLANIIGPGISAWLIRNGKRRILDKLLPVRNKYSLDILKQDALNYDTRSNWKIGNRNYYQAAVNMKCLDQCCCHMLKKMEWTKKSIIRDSAKYSSIGEWRKNSPNSYDASFRHGVHSKCVSSMKSKIKKWTTKTAKQEALKYIRRVDFQKKSVSAYGYARRNGILDEICGHMLKNNRQ